MPSYTKKIFQDKLYDELVIGPISVTFYHCQVGTVFNGLVVSMLASFLTILSLKAAR